MSILGALYDWVRHSVFGSLAGKRQEPDPYTDEHGSTAEITPERTSEPENRQNDDRWTVTVHPAPKFEKVGRIFQDGGDLVLRSDRDNRGFFIVKEDVGTALAGGTGAVRLLDSSATVGTARLSASGRALNMVIDGQLHTVPLRLLMLVVEGKRRKVALFVEV